MSKSVEGADGPATLPEDPQQRLGERIQPLGSGYAPGSRATENTGFCCVHCGSAIAKHPAGSYRNHCPRCLWSRHVDIAPGDRAADCAAPMEPMGVDHSGKKGYILLHTCTSCGANDRNRTAPDDDFDALIALMRPPVS